MVVAEGKENMEITTSLVELTTIYVMSQIFAIVGYGFLAATYFLKTRNKILIFSFISLIAMTISFLLLEAYAGVAMMVVAMIRNVIFLREGKRTTKITKKDIAILAVLYAITIAFAIFTYTSPIGLFSAFGSLLYTYSVWQKSPLVYKKVGIPVSVMWVIYNIYVFSVFGIVLETVLLVAATVGVIVATRENKERKS